MLMTWSEVSRGVPRSPNRHLDQFRVLRQFEIGRLQIQFNGFPDVGARFLLGFASRRAAGEFGAHRRVVAGLGIVFQNDSKRHSNSIGQRDAADRCSPTHITHTSPLPRHAATGGIRAGSCEYPSLAYTGVEIGYREKKPRWDTPADRSDRKTVHLERSC